MSSQAPPSPAKPWQFSLKSLLIALTLFAVLLAPVSYFGWVGFGMTFFVILVSVAVFFLILSRWPTITEFIIIYATVVVLALLLSPVVNVNRTPPFRNSCINNLRQLALAMHLYHEQHGCFPPAHIADDNGKPLHSWRVLLLPYLEEKRAYAQYRWDEPWNGPNNSQLSVNQSTFPSIFQCPADPTTLGSSMTSYVVVTGPGTAFPNDQSTSFDDFKNDGTSKTILIVEVANSGIHWMEPRDLNIQQMATAINAKTGQGISSTHGNGAIVVFADGHTQFLPNSITPEQLRAMLTVDGGAEAPVPVLD